MRIRRNKKRKVVELQPDEILLDAHNLPAFDKQQFEGRLERPIAKRSLKGMLIVMGMVGILFACRLGYLQIARATYYEQKSEQNSLDHTPIIADRGVVYDRNDVELAWNSAGPEGTTVRSYIPSLGFANMLGYVSYPTKDANGKYWQPQTVGKDGVEQEFNTVLSGKNGTNLIETDVSGNIVSQNTIDAPVQGENVTLSIDARVQAALADGIKNLAAQSGYVGGAGAIMDIRTGELIAMTTLPEYDQQVLSSGNDSATINGYINSDAHPFLNRMIDGLYTPGSIVKPFLSLAALHEHTITSDKILYTTGSLKIPNPYNPGQFTVFKDNANHGAVDMKHALAVSSNVYFYELGGGFGDQIGLGINNIEKYMGLFGIGQKTGFIASEQTGTVPSIAWKQKNFPGDPWRIGDTYHTSIGQYGFQVTPLQMLRAVAGIASRGTLVTPTLLKGDTPAATATSLPFTDAEYDAVYDGMRLAVTAGTAVSLNNDTVHVAAKTGTAQISNNTRVNSWVIGFFPYEHPRYAFTVLMESGPLIESGAANAFKPVVTLFASTPQLLDQE